MLYVKRERAGVQVNICKSIIISFYSFEVWHGGTRILPKLYQSSILRMRPHYRFAYACAYLEVNKEP